MEPHDNKQLALLKAISSHEQAAAGLTDLMGILDQGKYDEMLSRIEQNIADLHAVASESKPGDPL